MNLLPEAAAYLKKRVNDDLQSNRVSATFVAWLLPNVVDLEAARQSAMSILDKGRDSQRHYRDVAELAFASQYQVLNDEGKERLLAGLQWLSGRSLRISGSPADFCNDPISLLAFALAVKGVTKSEWDWVQAACAVASQHSSGWQSSVVSLAKTVLGSGEAIDSAEVKIVGFLKGLISDEPSQEEKSRVLDGLRASVLSDIESSDAVFRLAALLYIEDGMPRASISGASVAEVAALLRALPAGLQRWTWEDFPKTSASDARKWHIDHEYHVQNLLWLLLAPLFPDAKYEENIGAVGSVHPRLDIVIPSLRLIVEAKFWRKKDKSEKMIRELAEDASLYLTSGSTYDKLLPFIWDEAARTEEHALLVSGLKEIDGIVDAVIIPRPARMSES
jgi:hypothetical protein